MSAAYGVCRSKVTVHHCLLRMRAALCFFLPRCQTLEPFRASLSNLISKHVSV